MTTEGIYIIYSELLSNNSKAVAKELKKHKEQLDGIAALFPALPAEMQKMNQTLSTVLKFISAVPDMEAKLEDISNDVKDLHIMKKGIYICLVLFF